VIFFTPSDEIKALLFGAKCIANIPRRKGFFQVYDKEGKLLVWVNDPEFGNRCGEPADLSKKLRRVFKDNFPNYEIGLSKAERERRDAIKEKARERRGTGTVPPKTFKNIEQDFNQELKSFLELFKRYA
jgi:hypothetical protein